MADITWGIIGCGNVTEVKSGPAFKKIEGSHLIGVMRRDAAKAAGYAARHNVKRWYSDAEQLLNDNEINAVYIATPPSSHLSYALAAIEKGLNVYVEKPVTVNSAEAKRLADAAKHSNIKLSVAHYRRALPMFLFVKELLDRNAIGEIRTVQIKLWQTRKPQLAANVTYNWRVQPEISGGGYFHDLAPHQLDLMLFYFGEPDYYRGYSLNQSAGSLADDHVGGFIVFKNKVAVNGSWCFNVGGAENMDQCEIIGTEGRISFPFFGNTVYWKNTSVEENLTFVHPEHMQQPMIEKIVTYFKEAGPNPCSIEEAVVLMEIMDALTSKDV